MQSLRNLLPSLRRDQPVSEGAAMSSPELNSADVIDSPVKEKSSTEEIVLDLDEPEVDPGAAYDPDLNPGQLTLAEDTAGGEGRHLGVFTCTLLIVGRIIGTGIFSTPSSILGSVGSIGASFMIWVLGFVLSFCGLFIWMEFGCMFPRSGGEKVYLEAVYNRPKYFVTVIFASNALLLSSSASACVVFAQNILEAAGHPAPSEWAFRGIAVGAMLLITLMHGLTPRLGLYLMNALTVFKIGVLAFIVVTSWVVLSGHTAVKNPHANFKNAFAGSSHSSNDYATATFKVLSAYSGWQNVNYIMNNVKNPIRTLKIAGPLGLGMCAIMYIFANVAYFAASTKEEIEKSGTSVASLFFSKIFGEKTTKALTVFVALSAIGNVVNVTYTAARTNQEVAKEGIPLPGGNRFWASNWPTGKVPLPGLLIHCIFSLVVIIAPPPAVAYPFILDVLSYPTQIINLAVVIGLFYLRYKKPHIIRPFKVWWPLAVFFMVAAVFLLVAPFLKPSNGVGDAPPLPYYLYTFVGTGVMLAGMFYWWVWRKLLPWMGYDINSRKVTLTDGTVVSLFSMNKRE